MNRIYDKIRGVVRVEICGAFPETVFNSCALDAIFLWDMEAVNEYTVRFCVSERQINELRAICRRAMCDITVLKLSGGSRNRKLLGRRVVLLLCVLLTSLLLLLSSLFIWEIDIIGADDLSRAQVLRALSRCGVEEGSFWPAVSSDMVRSKMLTILPELAWMTVNVNGSRATVLLLERQEKPEIYVESDASYIIASQTGIISKMSVLNGKPLVSPGSSVLKGETLVTGLMDSLSNAPRAVRSQAEILAHTWHEITAVCPVEMEYKTGESRSYSRFALQIGKKRINFYLRGRNHIDECDKIIYENNLGLEGLFALPVSIIREEIVKTGKESLPRDNIALMRQSLTEVLEERIDGEILSCAFSSSRSDELQYVTLRAHCLEDIALNISMTQAEP